MAKAKKYRPGINDSSFTRLRMIAEVIEGADKSAITEEEVNKIYALAKNDAKYLERK